jgi:acyl-CoA reductase-like NAD-dependent aldehyde dehydrogenase
MKTIKKKVKVLENGNGVSKSSRVLVLKTYKIYIGGKFPRTESGRFYELKDHKGNLLANMCLSSRKDFRNAVVAARGAFGGWSSRAAFNRSQILYRIGEMLEGRRAQFVDELMQMGASQVAAEQEVSLSVDRLIYYSGWCDKYTQIFSSVNPVASAHFNFSVPEPTGVVAGIASESSGILGLVSIIAPVIAGGNTCIVLASEKRALCAISFAEVLNSSDVPGGVVNILTGREEELYEHMSTHMDVNSLSYGGSNKEHLTTIKVNAADNVKRVLDYSKVDWNSDKGESPYFIADHQETKTTWHPIENIGGAASSY